MQWKKDTLDHRAFAVVLMLTVGLGSPRAHACQADYNGDQQVSVQDIFDFLAGWFAGNQSADHDCSGSVSVQDIFEFLGAWFAGCPSDPSTGPHTVVLEDVNGDGSEDRAVCDPVATYPVGGSVTVFDSGGGQICQLMAPPDVGLFGLLVYSVCDMDGDGMRELAVSSVQDPEAEQLVTLIHVYSLPTCNEIARYGGDEGSSGCGTTGVVPRYFFCIPRTACGSTSVMGCRLAGGFGNGSCSGCKYTCTITTFEACTPVYLDCTTGPTTTRTSKTTKNKTCSGDPTNCPPTPRPGC